MENHSTFLGWGSQTEMPPVSYMMEVWCIYDNRVSLYVLHLLIFKLTTSLPNKNSLHLHLLLLEYWYSLHRVIEVTC